MTTTTVTITDTGKRRTSSASAEETDKANSGSAITLYGVEVTHNYQSILNTNPILGKLDDTTDAGSKFTHGEIDQLGVKAPKWSLRGILRENESSDANTFKYLRELAQTKGYKQLYGDLPGLCISGSTNGTVNVRVASVGFTHRSNSNIVEYSLEMWETA